MENYKERHKEPDAIKETHKGYEHSMAYQAAYDFSVHLHNKLKSFPKCEKFALSQEIRVAMDTILDEIETYEVTKTASHLHTVRRMNTEKNLIERICTPENAEEAYRKARRQKRQQNEVIAFEEDRENNLIGISDSLEDGSYEPGEYSVFRVFEPKERIIMALPFHDRVAQHMIVNVIEPIFDRRMYEHSNACRKGKGVHRASRTLSRWLYNMAVVQGRDIHGYSGDVHQYFQNVDHVILLDEIERYIGDQKLMGVIEKIIHHNGPFPEGKGIPVGNLTSQLFANVYLNILDTFIKEDLKAEKDVRYMDNFIILSDNPDELRRYEKYIPEFLGDRLKLEIDSKSTIVSAKNGIDFVGYRHFPGYTIMRKTATRKMKKLLRDFKNGETDISEFDRSFNSRIGHMKHADTYNLRMEYEKEAAELRKEKA